MNKAKRVAVKRFTRDWGPLFWRKPFWMLRNHRNIVDRLKYFPGK
jgi:hypothetical protein